MANTNPVNRLLVDFEKAYQQTKVDFAGFAQKWMREHPEDLADIEKEILWLKESSLYTDRMLAWSLKECFLNHKVN